MSKNLRKQQIDELEACRFLCRRLPGICLEDIQLNPKDPPDVIINAGEYVGIEVRQLLVDDELKSVEALENEIIALACQQAAADPPLMIHFYFRRPIESPSSNKKHRVYRISKNEKPVIAEQLYRRISELAKPLQNHEQVNAEIELPSLRVGVTIYKFNSLKDHLWQHAMGGLVKTDCGELIQEAIFDKEQDLHKYDTQITKRWLLLVAESDGESSFVEPSVNTLEYRYSTKFDRTFLLNWLTESIHELKKS